MAVYMEEKTNTRRVIYRYTDSFAEQYTTEMQARIRENT